MASDQASCQTLNSRIQIQIYFLSAPDKLKQHRRKKRRYHAAHKIYRPLFPHSRTRRLACAARQRKMSLAKIDRLAKVVNEFREAVYAEAKLIEKQKPEKQF